MARSIKKNPICTDGRNGQKIPKRFANKTVRNFDGDIPNGRFYKKLYCTWNIHDYVSRWPWVQAKTEYEQEEENKGWKKSFPTLKDFYRFWRRYYKNK